MAKKQPGAQNPKSDVIAEYLSLALAPSFTVAREIVESTFTRVTSQGPTPWVSKLAHVYAVVFDEKEQAVTIYDPTFEMHFRLDYGIPLAARILREAFYAADQYLHEEEIDALGLAIEAALRPTLTSPDPLADQSLARSEWLHQGHGLHQAIYYGIKGAFPSRGARPPVVGLPPDIQTGLARLVEIGDFPSVESAIETLLGEGIRKRLPEVRPPNT